jgi:CheY-like chemotaxis protein
METGQKFLIVDDDADDTDLFCEALQEIDPAHACVAVHDCGEALLKLRKETDVLPDFIFLDLNMPEMDGRTCLKEINKTARLKDIPIIIYTTSAHQEDREEMLKLGAAYFLTKATSFDNIVEGIKNAIEIVSR